ncbi:MAG: TlpA disulfide reductase family protein [Thermodesulfobacteriota bacterium]
MPLTRFPGRLVAVFVLLFLAACSGGRQERPLKIGDQAPIFTARDLDGQTISLAAWRGKPVILRFWSTDCKYCRADTPIFNTYFDKYRERGLRVVYISRNPDEKTVRDFVADLGIRFPVVIDAKGELAALYHVKIDPQTIVIDPQQKIVAAILGGVSEAELQKLLGTYL